MARFEAESAAPECGALDASGCVFATAATDGVVALWDLRKDGAAARFTSHANKRDPIRCAFSPCMRFLACGSEDKCAYVYDVRAGRDFSEGLAPTAVRLVGNRSVVFDWSDGVKDDVYAVSALLDRARGGAG